MTVAVPASMLACPKDWAHVGKAVVTRPTHVTIARAVKAWLGLGLASPNPTPNPDPNPNHREGGDGLGRRATEAAHEEHDGLALRCDQGDAAEQGERAQAEAGEFLGLGLG